MRVESIKGKRLQTGVAVVLFAVLGCAKAAPLPEQRSAAPTEARTTFVNRVWRVSQSSSVAPGQLYTFLSEGTLVIASPTGTPSLGTWRDDGGKLTIVEDSRPYNVKVLGLSETEFRIQINGPGDPVIIRFEPANTPLVHNGS